MAQVSPFDLTDASEKFVDRKKEIERIQAYLGVNLKTRASRLEEFFLAIREVRSGLNFRLFPHDNRLAIMILFAKPDSIRTVIRQVYRALITDKTCFFSSSRGYKCFVLNPHATLIMGLFGLAGVAGNPDLINQLIRLFFSVPK